MADVQVAIGLRWKSEAQFLLWKTIGQVFFDDVFYEIEGFSSVFHKRQFNVKNTSNARNSNRKAKDSSMLKFHPFHEQSSRAHLDLESFCLHRIESSVSFHPIEFHVNLGRH